MKKTALLGLGLLASSMAKPCTEEKLAPSAPALRGESVGKELGDLQEMIHLLLTTTSAGADPLEEAYNRRQALEQTAVAEDLARCHGHENVCDEAQNELLDALREEGVQATLMDSPLLQYDASGWATAKVTPSGVQAFISPTESMVASPSLDENGALTWTCYQVTSTGTHTWVSFSQTFAESDVDSIVALFSLTATTYSHPE